MKLRFLIITLIMALFIPAGICAQEIAIKSENVKELLPSYSYNLKRLIREAERNLKKVTEEIKEKELLDKNQEAENLVRGHFEKGNLLHQEGKLEEAKKEWQKVLDITKDPEMKKYILKAGKIAREEKALKERKKREEQLLLKRKLSKLYKEAISLYRYKKYQEASLKFTEVQNLSPGYAKTDYYLGRINKDIYGERIASLYREGIAFYDNEELDEAESRFKEIISLDPAHVKAKKYVEYLIPKEKREAQRTAQRREKEKTRKEKLLKEKETKKEADELYKEALGLYKEKKHDQSYQKFQELQTLSPGYAKTEYYLRRIPSNIDKEKQWLEHQKEKRIHEIIQEIERKKRKEKQDKD